MSANAARCSPAQRRRALALMGIDVYRPRAPSALRRGLAVVVAAGPSPRDSALWRHVLLALGLTPQQVHWGEPPAPVPVLYLGAAGAAHTARYAVPDWESIRGQPQAKRALWAVLKQIRRAG